MCRKWTLQKAYRWKLIMYDISNNQMYISWQCRFRMEQKLNLKSQLKLQKTIGETVNLMFLICSPIARSLISPVQLVQTVNIQVTRVEIYLYIDYRYFFFFFFCWFIPWNIVPSMSRWRQKTRCNQPLCCIFSYFPSFLNISITSNHTGEDDSIWIIPRTFQNLVEEETWKQKIF
jgi:hypothetical protein